MKEGAEESFVAGDLPTVSVGSTPEFVDPVGGVVGKRVHFEIRPEGLDRIQLRGVGREENGVDGGATTTQLSGYASMDIEAIPDEDDGGTEVTAKCPDEGQKVFGHDVLVGKKRKVKSHPTTAGRNGQGRDHGDSLVGTSPLIQNGSFSHGSPGPADEGGHEKPALVQEDQGGFQPPGVFFTRGHWVLTQPRIAASSRSRARRSGF